MRIVIRAPAQLRIRRAHALPDRLNSYEVYVGGQKVGKVKDNAEVEIGISAGRHQVQVRAAAWIRGKAITVDVAEGGTCQTAAGHAEREGAAPPPVWVRSHLADIQGMSGDHRLFAQEAYVPET